MATFLPQRPWILIYGAAYWLDPLLLPAIIPSKIYRQQWKRNFDNGPSVTRAFNAKEFCLEEKPKKNCLKKKDRFLKSWLWTDRGEGLFGVSEWEIRINDRWHISPYLNRMAAGPWNPPWHTRRVLGPQRQHENIVILISLLHTPSLCVAFHYTSIKTGPIQNQISSLSFFWNSILLFILLIKLLCHNGA